MRSETAAIGLPVGAGHEDGRDTRRTGTTGASGASKAPDRSDRTAVIITIDAEIAPHTSNWRRDGGRFALNRDVYGITDRGSAGCAISLASSNSMA